jgi:hypothetical protein
MFRFAYHTASNGFLKNPPDWTYIKNTDVLNIGRKLNHSYKSKIKKQT